MEADLIRVGLRLRDLGSESFTWTDLRALITHSPPDSALRRKLDVHEGWTADTFLLAAAVDALNWIAWTKTVDGQKNRNRPRPLPRPGMTEPKSKPEKPRDHLVLDLEEYKRRLNLPRKSLK